MDDNNPDSISQGNTLLGSAIYVPTAIPEPSGFIVLLTGSFFFLMRRRR